jgi:hypothetical protein
MLRQLSRLIGITVGLVFFSLPILQAETPYPFARMGVIDGIYPQENRLVINDVNFRFPPSIPIYLYHGEADNEDPKRDKRPHRHTLHRGMRVGFTAVKNDSQRPAQLVEVWILPPGSIRDKGEQG